MKSAIHNYLQFVVANAHCGADLSGDSKSMSSFIEIPINLQLKCILEHEELTLSYIATYVYTAAIGST